MAYRQYTHCVQPADYVDPLPRTDNAVEVIAALLDVGLGGWLPDAILGCDYLLGGKLVCLGGDECAIGHITVPPFTPAGDPAPAGMTPGQTQTWNNQRQPENQWVLHPLIDGCQPADQPPPR